MMGDLTAATLLSSSSSSSCSSSLPSIPSASLRGGDKASFSRDHQLAPSRIGFEACRNLYSRSQQRKAWQWRALLDDQRIPFGLRGNEQAADNEENLNVFDRLALAWRILFPKRKKVVSNAEVAKQRLKMILISDRCSVNDNAKRKIVNNIVGALADFVEIESQDRVQLNVSADPDLGTVYSVSVPVRRVRPEFQDNGNEVSEEELREDLGEFEEERFDFPGALEVQTCDSFSSEDLGACNVPDSRDVEG